MNARSAGDNQIAKCGCYVRLYAERACVAAELRVESLHGNGWMRQQEMS